MQATNTHQSSVQFAKFRQALINMITPDKVRKEWKKDVVGHDDPKQQLTPLGQEIKATVVGGVQDVGDIFVQPVVATAHLLEGAWLRFVKGE